MNFDKLKGYINTKFLINLKKKYFACKNTLTDIVIFIIFVLSFVLILEKDIYEYQFRFNKRPY